jgi:ABC-2 type transport system ATP-binding protein
MLHIHGVRFAYPRKKPLFDDLAFQVSSGEVIGLLGKNGAGKTSLLKIGTGLLFPQSGDVELFDGPAFSRRPEALARIAYVPEQFEVPSVHLKDYVAYQSGYFPRFDGELMEHYLQRFEIVGNEMLTKLSFGQQKKILLAFALAGMAELVILDEPTNGLDIPSKQVFRQLVAEASDDRRAFIISTHQVRDVENLIDPIVILDGGRVVFQADLAEIQENFEMRRFESEMDALEAGALAADTRLGSSLAFLPRGRTGGSHKSGESVGDSIDLELLFQAAVSHPREMQTLCGGVA